MSSYSGLIGNESFRRFHKFDAQKPRTLAHEFYWELLGFQEVVKPSHLEQQTERAGRRALEPRNALLFRRRRD